MENERYYGTPTFTKDAEYCECERCDGDGWIEVELIYQVQCPTCNGSGKLEIKY